MYMSDISLNVVNIFFLVTTSKIYDLTPSSSELHDILMHEMFLMKCTRHDVSGYSRAIHDAGLDDHSFLPPVTSSVTSHKQQPLTLCLGKTAGFSISAGFPWVVLSTGYII